MAEAAKVIENTQRDLNIALMNELSIIFEKMDIDTLDVLGAAGQSGIFYHLPPDWSVGNVSVLILTT